MRSSAPAIIAVSAPVAAASSAVTAITARETVTPVCMAGPRIGPGDDLRHRSEPDSDDQHGGGDPSADVETTGLEKGGDVQHMRDEEGENACLEPGVGSHQHHIADQRRAERSDDKPLHHTVAGVDGQRRTDQADDDEGLGDELNTETFPGHAPPVDERGDTGQGNEHRCSGPHRLDLGGDRASNDVPFWIMVLYCMT